MAIDPSPTAEATRLMLPQRTSPTANTPGRLVSSRYGGRVERPVRGGEIFVRQFRSGLDEALRVEREAALEPLVLGTRTGHHEHVPDVARLDVAGRRVAPVHALEMLVALERRRSRVRVRSVIAGFSSMRRIRYRDMLSRAPPIGPACARASPSARGTPRPARPSCRRRRR